MPKRRRAARRSRRPRTHPAAPPEERKPDLIADVRGMLRGDEPLELLMFVSAMLTAVDPRDVDPFAAEDDESGPDLQDLTESFVEVELVETSALLGVLAELVPDELLAQRMRREVARRDHRLPRWLRGLAPLTVDRAVVTSHVLGDGDNVLLAARTGAGDDLTALVYIDHNLGTLVKDAFVIPARLEEVLDQFGDASGGDPDLAVQDLDLADARARITEAIELASMTYPPLETDTWPSCRALVEWMVRQLPEGGTGYARPEWDDPERAALTDRFFASPFGRGHDEVDRQLFESLLWFGCDYGPGDPLRWSPVAVQILLSDWLPRKVLAEPELLARAPALLRSLIRFSHAERGIRPELTEETLAAVDALEPDYQEAIRSPRPQGPAALLAAMGILDEADRADDFTVPSYGEQMSETLREEVGGEEALQTLDTEPLPNESFAWEVVPDDVRGRVAEVLALTDRCCDELLDAECRTACRRLLADVTDGDAEIFRRRGRAETAAAAIAWAVAKANQRLSQRGLTAKALQEWFGLSGSPSQRAITMLKAIDIDLRDHYGGVRLGSPRYLTSARRRQLIELRDRYATTDD